MLLRHYGKQFLWDSLVPDQNFTTNYSVVGVFRSQTLTAMETDIDHIVLSFQQLLEMKSFQIFVLCSTYY